MLRPNVNVYHIRKRPRKCTYLVVSTVIVLFWQSRVQPENGPVDNLKTTTQQSLACKRLGIDLLNRVEPLERRRVQRLSDKFSWDAGHFAYHMCPTVQAGSVLGRVTAVLTTLDENYVDLLPWWAKAVKQAASSKCFVLVFDAETCAAVEAANCSCLQYSESSEGARAVEEGWHPRRVEAVKLRFLAAAELVADGYDVVMHDADAILSQYSIVSFLEYVHQIIHALPTTRLVVQDNGIRKVAYDRVNWGFAWIRNHSKNVELFKCTLDRWNDAAFGCTSRRCDHSYHSRSQPRINHIMENVFMASRDEFICLISNKDLRSFGIRHMTGYTNPLVKKTCAKAEGALTDEAQTLETIAYRVAHRSSPAEQKNAFENALRIAKHTQRKLEIPRAYFDGQLVDFCLLFDVQQPSLHGLLAASISACGQKDFHIRINNPIETLWNYSARHVCLDFYDLVSYKSTSEFQIYLCNPHNPEYMGLHMCRRHQSRVDEI